MFAKAAGNKTILIGKGKETIRKGSNYFSNFKPTLFNNHLTLCTELTTRNG